MTRREQGILDTMQKVQTFKNNHVGDFQPNGKAVQCFAANDQFVQQVVEASQSQTTGGRRSRGGTLSKSAQGLQVRVLLGTIIKTGRRVFRNNPAIEGQFRTPLRGTNQQLLTEAQAMRELASTHKQEFLDAEMPADFLDELDAALVGFASAKSDKVEGEQLRAGATSAVGQLLKSALVNIRDLDVMVRNRYRGDAQITGEWKTASHLEAQPRKTIEEPAPEPSPV